MSIKEQIDQDLKTAMLAGEKDLVTTLRGLKSVILYAEVASGDREAGLTDDQIIDAFSKEAKKRQESSELYTKGGNDERAAAELVEKTIIEKYLPAQLGDAELASIIDAVITETGAPGPQAMGQVIGGVKAKTKGAADGAKIAQLVKERLSQ